MPIAANPDRTTTFWLTCDEEKPAAERATFRCRFMTSDERDQIADLYEEAVKADRKASKSKILEAIGIGISGWDNLATPKGEPVPSGEVLKLPSALSELELWELLGLMVRKTDLAENELKKSLWQRASGAVPSAGTAEDQAAAGDAGTSPTS